MSVNVLVVDDSDIIRKMIIKTMRIARLPLGSVFEASNGREALEVLEDEWVDVIFADLNMPVMDGLELIRRVRASERLSDISVVVITSEGAELGIERLGEMGVDACVRKPFTPEQIREVVCSVASRIVNGEHREMLEDVLGRVLSLFAMMFCEAASAADASPGGELMRARMCFSGGANGALTLAAPVELCTEMAANALGVEVQDDRAREKAGDAVGELVNISCGQIAAALERYEETRLSPPEVALIDSDEWQVLAEAPSTVRFVVEDRPLLASLALRSH